MARQSLAPMREIDLASFEKQLRERISKRKSQSPMTHLKYLRKRSGYTLETLSEITSISISYLSRLESGSRRLNTDLIKRLSHAFGCTPSELLQETSHENKLITPTEFTKKRKLDTSAIESNMPVYCIAPDENDSSKLAIKICSPNEWKQRPIELSAKENVFAMKTDNYFAPHFSASSTLYLEQTTNLAPESIVVILNRGQVLIKKVWSITPTSLQLCEMSDIELLKKGNISSDKLIEIERNSVDATYRVVGYSDFCLS